MAFNFGFGGDDIDSEDITEDVRHADHGSSMQQPEEATSAPPRSHQIQELIDKLPSKIAWTTINIASQNGRSLLLPRRELFDVRLQLMAEDESLESLSKIPGLDDADIRTNVYEGGFKSWECSYDLAALLLNYQDNGNGSAITPADHVLEMGCGTAIPSSVAFYAAITNNLPTSFTFTDYNADVLELVTFPNLFLTWMATLKSDGQPFLELAAEATGDVDITPELKSSFLEAVTRSHSHFTFVSGSWTPADPWLSHVPISAQVNTLVLASETIYSPEALGSFTTALARILKDSRSSKALVSAKRIYFGVGGSVDAFKYECRARGLACAELDGHDLNLGQAEGVRRCLLEARAGS